VSSRLRGPWVFGGLAFIGMVFVLVPLVALLQRAGWSELTNDLGDPATRDALRLSLVCSLWATVFAVTFGVPTAWLLARVDFRGRAILRALVILPLVLPPVVGGVALLAAFGREGLVGRYLYDWLEVQFTFSSTGVVLAETFVAMPFVVIAVEAGFRSIDRRYEDAASSLGAGRGLVFRRITLPMLAPSLLAGAVLAWARALGEFGATITFAGNIEGRTRTLPLAIYLALETDREAAVALSVVLLTVSVTVLVALRSRWLRIA